MVARLCLGYLCELAWEPVWYGVVTIVTFALHLMYVFVWEVKMVRKSPSWQGKVPAYTCRHFILGMFVSAVCLRAVCECSMFLQSVRADLLSYSLIVPFSHLVAIV